MKIDAVIKDMPGIDYPVAIILKRTNTYRNDIFYDFLKLIDRYNNEK